ncbi:MAG: hypothetical protein EPO36_05065 [Chloroflexota bacterium]|nr:MAG: hypothetical protein EPO36_05065 [Chloroflexota bacterium]
MATSPEPTAEPTVEPTDGPATPAPDGTVVVDLANATDHAVTARIIDESSVLASAESGQPGDGMSVRWHDSLLENVNEMTLRLTWVGLPFDDTVEISITGSAEDLELTIVQKGPPIDSDAVGYDRVLNLTFSEPVRSEDVSINIEDSPAG